MSYSKIPLNGIFTVTCAFGEKNPRYACGWHTGVDLVNDDLIIYSPTFGKVFNTGYSSSYGNFVVIADDTPDDTHYHWLCHLNSYCVVAGQDVDPTTQIGIMGSTGNVTGIHLHYEIRNYLNEYSIVDNPCDYMGIPNKRGTYNEADYQVDDPEPTPEPTPEPSPSRDTVGQYRVLADYTYLWSEPDLSGERYEYKAGTTLEILENVDDRVDKVRALATGREAYVDINAYEENNEPNRNTVGEVKRFAGPTIIYENPNLSGKEYNYKPNTSVKILENVDDHVDKVRVRITRRVGYVDINNYA